jgi:hypothetical protein
MNLILKKRIEFQLYHLISFIFLGVLQYFALTVIPVGKGKIWDLTTGEWVGLSWFIAGVFQAWVAFFWRMELYGSWITNKLGKFGFILHQVGYEVLGLFRFLPLVPICISSKNTLPVSPILSITIIIIATPPILWAIYSAIVRFGFARAAGADHFYQHYRDGGFENKGMYRFVPNVMYTVALFWLYHLGLFWFSSLGLVVAACHHIFVWAHYFCTEKT